MSKWIEFIDLGQLPKAKTKKWQVIARDDGARLGQITWFAHWRRYCFWSNTAVFEERCLRDIADFCDQQTKTHREARRK